MKLSLTGTSIAVWLITALLTKYGFKVEEGSIVSLVESIINIASVIGILYGQYRRPEVKGFIFK